MREYYVIAREKCAKCHGVGWKKDTDHDSVWKCADCDSQGYVQVRVLLSEALAEMGVILKCHCPVTQPSDEVRRCDGCGRLFS